MKALLKYAPDIDVNAETPHKMTALFAAAKAGHKGVVKKLVKRPDCSVNVQTDEGWTPLNMAIHNGHHK